MYCAGVDTPHLDVYVPQAELPPFVHSDGAVLSLRGGPLAHELHGGDGAAVTAQQRHGLLAHEVVRARVGVEAAGE